MSAVSPLTAPAMPANNTLLNTIATAVVVVVSFLLPPCIYGIVAYSNLAADMAADSRVVSEVVQRIAANAPKTWMAKKDLIATEIAGHVHYGSDAHTERVTIFDTRGNQVAVTGDVPAFPRMTHVVPIDDKGVRLGQVETQRSLRPLIVNAALVSLFGLALAFASFLTFRVIPLRTTLRTNEALRARDHSLAFANTVLVAATEGSLDAILIVDAKAHIVSYNQHFVELWQIPHELVAARVDAPVLEVVTSRTKDPAAFIARVKYLYDHPGEEGREKIETKDGRIIDRYSRSLHGPNDVYLGRIWFFRDITERERAAEALKQSEIRFKAIFDHARDGIAMAETKSKKLTAGNASFCRMVGYSPEELTGLNIADFHPPEALAEIVHGFERQVRGEIDLAHDLPMIRKDGSIFYADISVSPIVVDGTQYLLGIFHDVSERKIADDKIKFANTLLQAEIESAPDGVFVVHSDPPDLSFNRNFLDMCSIPHEVEHSRDSDLVLASILPKLKNPEAFERDVRELRDHPDVSVRFHEVEFKDGRTVEYFGSGIKGQSGAVLGRIWFFRDISERKRAAEALAQSEARFKVIFDNARDGIALTDPETQKFLLSNAYLHQMLGYTAEEFTGFGMSDIHPAESIGSVMYEFERHQRGDRRVATDVPVKRKDGSIFFVDINSAPVEIGGKRVVLGIFRDATTRREAEDAVRKSEERYRNLVESTTDYIWEIDQNGHYTYYTPAVADLLGYAPNEIMGKTPFDLMPPAEAKRVGEVFGPIAAAHQPFSMLENTMVTKGGVEIVMETSGVPVFDENGRFCGYRGIERDITQRKSAEQEIAQRDVLLHAVAESATGLLTAPSLDEAIPHALAIVGKALHVDRVIVLERPLAFQVAPSLRYVWHTPGLNVLLDSSFFENPLLTSPDIAVWRDPLSAGKVVKVDRRTATGDIRKLMELLDNQSTLIVPVTVDGKFWGQVGFDACKRERSWRDFEIEILTTLGDLIGNAIQRDRYVTEITNANRIVQNTPTILYRLNGVPSLPMIYISQNVKLFGYEPIVLTESPHLYQELIHPDDIEEVREKQAQSLESDNTRGVFEFRLLTSRGDYRWVENRYSQIRDAAGRLTEIEGLLIDITERKVAEEKIALLARTDPLTGLANRNTFIERLRQSFVGARRGASGFALLYIDLDHFKDINDTRGHPIGDRFLFEVGERIKKSIRDADLAGRLGGDEFAVLQAELTESADAGTLAQKIRDALAEPYQIAGNTLHMTASIGIAIYGPETQTAEDLLAQADIALYRAKEEGRDQYRFHTEELDIEVREQVELADELRGALSRSEFRLHYQPQVELSSGRIVGMEALIRWEHPTRGLLSPSAFIPVAERTGTITAIGRWVLEHACEQMHKWREAGCPPNTLAVNISPIEIKSGDEFVAFVRTTLTKWDLAPQTLELDVTESMLARATLTQNDVLERLRQLGVKISIDDFGTKYSSLDYLRTYQVNRLKIPKSLTGTAMQNPENAAMVRAIVGIARELNIEVIAQGVESEREWSFLTATSPVSKVQGYYYSEPVSAERAGEMLRGGRLTPEHQDTAAKAKSTAT